MSSLVCQQRIASGPRRGELCGRKCSAGMNTCGIHRERTRPSLLPPSENQTISIEQPHDHSSLVDSLVSSMLDENGQSTIIVGECPICYQNETSIVSFPCHTSHSVCIPCLEKNYLAKDNQLVCPHCRHTVDCSSVDNDVSVPEVNQEPIIPQIRIYVPMSRSASHWYNISKIFYDLRRAYPTYDIKHIRSRDVIHEYHKVPYVIVPRGLNWQPLELIMRRCFPPLILQEQ